MTHPPFKSSRATPSSRPEPALDVMAVLAALQDQIDQLTTTVEAHQVALDSLRRTLDEGGR